VSVVGINTTILDVLFQKPVSTPLRCDLRNIVRLWHSHRMVRIVGYGVDVVLLFFIFAFNLSTDSGQIEITTSNISFYDFYVKDSE
jgi:hypothetical protein